ncbi:MAG: NAD-dependent epimerase/dehydratase family protein [Actinomycetota bacterium]|nr:NAD-dependent epimerase/dehydratase family protein [Actinomycetota bacterium]
MRVLVIGGTRFVGRHLTHAALARGHDVVLFNRGQTNAELFPEAVTVHGDRRAGGLDQLFGESFDAVFDTAAYYPDDVIATAAIAPGVAHYALVSTVSVYRDPLSRHADETSPLWEIQEPLPKSFATPEEYGALKARCEAKAAEIYSGRALIVRPGLIIGPHDYTDRLTSWLRRLSTRDSVLGGEADQPLQLIDVRDVAEWMIQAAEAGVRGIFNAVGPDIATSFADFISIAASVCGADVRVVWAGDRFLGDHDVAVPLWIPREDHPFFELANARARAAGLSLRPLDTSIADVKVWNDARPGHSELTLSTAREDELLGKLSSERKRRANPDVECGIRASG